MLCIEWDESYNLGISQIDYQHRFLFDIMNRLCQAINKGKGDVIINRILDEMAGYAVSHFVTEEEYFDEFSYQKTDEHKTQHQEFHKKVSDLRISLEKGEQKIALKTLDFLSKWFKEHVKKYDRDYVEFFLENGVK